MGSKSKKPPNRNDSVKVSTRDPQTNFENQSAAGSATGSNKNKCWTFELVDPSTSADVLQINDPVNADVTETTVTVYNDNSERIGEAPADKSLKIFKAAKAEGKFVLNGNVTMKSANNIEVRLCL